MSINLIIFVLINLLSTFGVHSACTTGWFGIDCQYQCHCTTNNCDSGGVCQNSSRCVSGWFGPACQYRDLLSVDGTTTTPSNTTVLKDRDDDTCLNGSTTNVTVNFDTDVSMTWIRFNVKRPELRHNVTMLLNGSQNALIGCKTIFSIDQRTVDLFCDSNMITPQITLIGSGVGSLCSLYFSGGRNVALKQSALQSTTYTEEAASRASNAVDGNTDGRFSSGSCTHTGVNDPAPNWNVTFSKMQRIQKYVIYNRDSLQDRLIDFNLSSFSTNDTSVFDYTFQKPSRSVYTVIATPHNVSFVKIYTSSRNKILTLCEMEMYGETVCDHNRYGLECNKPCNCENKTETCHVATGGCPSGCAAGFYGEDCHTTCPSLKWGVDCLNTCSAHCVNHKCNRTNGFCDLGCEIGFVKDTCENACSGSTWGQDCSNRCSENCVRGTCSNIDGLCTFGCNSGYMGDDCTKQCPFLKWGNTCREDCNPNCFNQTCDNRNGTCDSGCHAGYMGHTCSDSCSLTTWGENCANPCSDHCVNKTCDRFNGSCVSGCQGRYTGDRCDQESSTDYYELGVGLGVGLTLLTAVCIGVAVVIVIVRRSRHQDVPQDVMKNATVIIKHTKVIGSSNEGPEEVKINDDNKNNDTADENSNKFNGCIVMDDPIIPMDSESYLTPREFRKMKGQTQSNIYSSEDQDCTLDTINEDQDYTLDMNQ